MLKFVLEAPLFGALASGFAVLSLVILFSGAPVAAAQSAYTKLDLTTCETLQRMPDEGGSVFLKCPGYQGYPIYFKAGDLRQSVFFGILSEAILREAWQSFGAFNQAGDTVEWRLGDGGEPFAAILRFHIETINPATGASDEAHRGQVLVVSRVGQPGEPSGCVVGYVDARANPSANALARRVADSYAAPFVCGVDRAVFHGERGALASEPTSVFPEPGE